MKIINMAVERKKGALLLINKWDSSEDEQIKEKEQEKAPEEEDEKINYEKEYMEMQKLVTYLYPDGNYDITYI